MGRASLKQRECPNFDSTHGPGQFLSPWTLALQFAVPRSRLQQMRALRIDIRDELQSRRRPRKPEDRVTARGEEVLEALGSGDPAFVHNHRVRTAIGYLTITSSCEA
jgi:hypothetical protein